VIGSLRGTVLERVGDGAALVEVAGVGYLVQVTPRACAEMEPTTPVFLHVHHHVREDGETLYGFLDRDERRAFELLIGVHGIGPTMAMGILGHLAPAALADAVAAGDLAALVAVPGIGRKTAERLVVELRDRLSPAEGDRGGAGGSAIADVRGVLAGLGYDAEEIREALREVRAPEGGVGDPERLLRDALGVLAARRA
jgi:Holliday junction DNA helicase RuvA